MRLLLSVYYFCSTNICLEAQEINKTQLFALKLAFLNAICSVIVVHTNNYEGLAEQCLKSNAKKSKKDFIRSKSEINALDIGFLVNQLKRFETGMREAIYAFSNGSQDLWEHGIKSVLHIQQHIRVKLKPAPSEDMTIWRTNCSFIVT